MIYKGPSFEMIYCIWSFSIGLQSPGWDLPRNARNLKTHLMLLVVIILDSDQNSWIGKYQNSWIDGHGLGYCCCYICVFTNISSKRHKISHIQPVFFADIKPPKPKISTLFCVSSTGSQSFLTMEWLEASGYLIHAEIFKIRYFLSFGLLVFSLFVCCL